MFPILITSMKRQHHSRLLIITISINDDRLELVTDVATVSVVVVIEGYDFLLRSCLFCYVIVAIVVINIVAINIVIVLILRMVLPHQLFQRLEYPLTRCLLLEPQHVLLVLVHQPKTQPTFIFQILLAHFQQPYPKLVIICLLVCFFLYVQESRIATDVTFGP